MLTVEEQQRIRSYLQAQAAKLAVPEIIARVRADSAALRAVVEAAAEVDQQRAPANGEWSINAILNHLHESGRRVNAGIEAAGLRGEQPPTLKDIIEPTSVVRPATEWFDELLVEREVLFDRVAALSGTEHLDIRWEHPFFGHLNWREWLLFLRLHDLDHGGQVRAIVEIGRDGGKAI